MKHFVEDYQKRRLTEHLEILSAIKILKSRGCPSDELLQEITRIFYVDLDEYNRISSLAA